MTVIIDSREKRHAEEIIRYLMYKNVPIRVEKLEFGDYFVNPDYIVERKRVTDLLNSLKTGRLWEQLEGLKSADVTPILVLEGSISDVKKRTGWSYESVMGLIASICFDWNIVLIPTASKHSTACLIYALYRRTQKKDEKKRPIFKPKAETMDEIVLRVVGSLPGVSSARAEALLKHFGSIRRLANATVDEIESVEGIGRKTAEKIVETFTHIYGLKIP